MVGPLLMRLLVALSLLVLGSLSGCLQPQVPDAGAEEAPEGRMGRLGVDADGGRSGDVEGEPVLPAADGSAVVEAVGRLAAVGGGRYGAAAVWDGEAFYVLGGYEGGKRLASNAIPDVLRYEPGQALAEPAGTLVGATWDAAAVTDGGRILVFGGADPQGGTLDVVQAYDPDGARSMPVGQMPTGRSMVAAASTELGTFVFGGSEGHGFEVLRHSPVGDVTSVNPTVMPTATMGAQAATIDGFVYVVGGQTGTSPLGPAGSPIDAVLRFDPASGVFEEVATLPGGRGHGTLVAHGDLLYYFGGFASGRGLDEIVRIDVVAGSAVLLEQRLPVALSSVTGASDGTHVYLFGGNSPDGPSPYVLRVDLARLA